MQRLALCLLAFTGCADAVAPTVMPDAVVMLQLESDRYGLDVGESRRIRYLIATTGAASPALVWSSDRPNVTVSEYGDILGVTPTGDAAPALVCAQSVVTPPMRSCAAVVVMPAPTVYACNRVSQQPSPDCSLLNPAAGWDRR